MRSPVIAFGLFAAAAVSPTLVSAAPAPPKINEVQSTSKVAAANAQILHTTPISRSIPEVGGLVPNPNGVQPSHTSQHASSKKKHEHKSSKPKRALDGNTAGGNAYSGGTNDATGGSIVNESNSGDTDTITNETASMLKIPYVY